MPLRVLILGSTGVDKEYVLGLIESHMKGGMIPPENILYKDFEKDFLSDLIEEFHDYLDGKEQHQQYLWSKAWKNLDREINDDSNLILSMHGMLARPLFTNRSPILLNELESGKFTHIITLIDDVHDMWNRTETRAKSTADL